MAIKRCNVCGKKFAFNSRGKEKGKYCSPKCEEKLKNFKSLPVLE